jgi:hypothetical protein
MGQRHHMAKHEPSIIQHFNILNECLHLLSQCNIKIVKKLRMETCLIRAKRFLLNDTTTNNIMYLLCSDDAFVGLLRRTRRVCVEVAGEDSVADFIEHINGILTMLGGNLDH